MPSPAGKSSITGAKYLAMAGTLPGSVIDGCWLGAQAEHWLHWPVLRALGISLGTVSGLSHIIRQLLADEKRLQAPGEVPK